MGRLSNIGTGGSASMAVGLSMLKCGRKYNDILRRFAHTISQHPALETPIGGFQLPTFSFPGGAMELMAVPKKKTSPHKRGIRNGPKALKPQPVIVLCKACGRVKLQHFFCCSGKKEHSEHNQ